MNVYPQSIKVRDLGFRWVSCSKFADVNFHWQTMTLPIHAVDYIIVYELSHIKIKQHIDEFWQQIGRIIPNYRTRKRWVAVNSANYLFSSILDKQCSIAGLLRLISKDTFQNKT